MSEVKLLGATLLHTRYGHWYVSGRYFPTSREITFIKAPRKVQFPGLRERIIAALDRTKCHMLTEDDLHLSCWLAAFYGGQLSIYDGSSWEGMLMPPDQDLSDPFEYWCIQHSFESILDMMPGQDPAVIELFQPANSSTY